MEQQKEGLTRFILLGEAQKNKLQMRKATTLASKKRLLNMSLDGLFKSGALSTLKYGHRNSLTVLNYHRVDEYSKPGFDTFSPNVSATPAVFSMQMEYVKQHYNVVTCDQLVAWLKNKAELPPYSALITFDDGYHDNLAQAYPILRKNGLSAVIFLATDYIGKSIPFFWDYVAYCFFHTEKDSVQLSSYENISWQNMASREKAMLRWINVVKLLPDEEKKDKVNALTEQLNVHVPDGAFKGLCLTWDQVGEMSNNGMEFGAHTVHHPILTRIALPRAEEEITNSKYKVESEIRKPVVSFAYPNGQVGDFSPEIVKLVKQAGFDLAFTLIPGPMKNSAVRKNPLTIRRVFLGNFDTMPRFAAKLTGLIH